MLLLRITFIYFDILYINESYDFLYVGKTEIFHRFDKKKKKKKKKKFILCASGPAAVHFRALFPHKIM